MRRSSLTPADRRRFAAILFIGAAVFLLIAILFFRAGRMEKNNQEDPAPSNAPSSAVSQTPGTPASPDVPEGPDASEPPEGTDEPTETPEPTPTLPPPSPTPEVDLYEKLDFRPSTMFNRPETYVVSSPDGELNVRSGPSTAYEKLGVLYTGTPVEVHTIENGWALVMFEERYAWCSANYLVSASEE